MCDVWKEWLKLAVTLPYLALSWLWSMLTRGVCRITHLTFSSTCINIPSLLRLFDFSTFCFIHNLLNTLSAAIDLLLQHFISCVSFYLHLINQSDPIQPTSQHRNKRALDFAKIHHNLDLSCNFPSALIVIVICITLGRCIVACLDCLASDVTERRLMKTSHWFGIRHFIQLRHREGFYYKNR